MRTISWLACVTLSLAACGGGGGRDAGADDDADLTPDTGLPDAEPPDTGLPDADPPDAEPPDGGGGADASGATLYGYVLISEVDNGGTASSEGNAAFKTTPLLGSPIASGGGCDQYDALTTEGMSAGTIAVAGANTPFTLVPAGSPPTVTYSPVPDPLPTDLFNAGATLSVTAPGADFPAFTGSVVAPAAVVGFTPPASFSRSTPPTFTWTAGTSDYVWVEIVTLDMGGMSQAIFICPTTDDGSFAISTAMTALIPASHTFAGMVVVRINDTALTPTATSEAHLMAATGTAGFGPLVP